jgi:alkylation response protein AidB-like acyl-CoA dehydrogenase
MSSDRRLRVSLSDDEKRIITTQADLLGMSANGYIRMKAFAPGTDISIHLTDRMQATSAIGLSLNSARRLEAQLKPLIQDQSMLIEMEAELEQLQIHLSAAQAHLFQPNPYAG